MAGNDRSSVVSLIRGLAIIGVVLVHMPHFYPGLSAWIKDMFSFGQMGCQAFFVLSGYCLCVSASRNQDFSVRRYFKRRLSSIAPGYWMTILINFLLCLIVGSLVGIKFLPTFDDNLLHILANVLLINGFIPYIGPMNSVVLGGWFVGAIVIMYLLFPLLYKVYSVNCEMWRQVRRYVFPLLTVIVCDGLMIISGIGQDSYCELSSVKYFSFVNQLPCFVIGFALYDYQTDSRNWSIELTKLVVMLLVTLVLFYGHFSFSYVLAPVTASLSVVFLFALVNNYVQEHRFTAFIEKLGDKSYAIYLSHFWIAYGLVPFLCTVSNLKPNGYVNCMFFISLPVLLLLSYYIAMMYDRLIALIKI